MSLSAPAKPDDSHNQPPSLPVGSASPSTLTRNTSPRDQLDRVAGVQHAADRRRRSLEILEASSRAQLLPEDTPLPDSRGTSGAALAPPPVLDEGRDVPLPEPSSGSASLRNEDSEVSSSSRYRHFVHGLAKHLPHLENVLHESRLDSVSVACFDMAGRELHQRHDFDESSVIRENGGTSLRRLLESDPNPKVDHRIILVEDLNQSLMDTLGSALGLSPEFFEEHLLNSGWRDSMSSNLDARDWPTGHLERNYASLKWPRPVRIANQPFNRASALEEVQYGTSGSYLWRQPVTLRRKKVQKTHPVWNRVARICNILRPAWSFALHDTELVSENLSFRGFNKGAWEERATLCVMRRGACSLVVILLDPLPLLNHWTKGSAESLAECGFSSAKLKMRQELERVRSLRPWSAILTTSSRVMGTTTATIKKPTGRLMKKGLRPKGGGGPGLLQMLGALRSSAQVDQQDVHQDKPTAEDEGGRKVFQRDIQRRQAEAHARSRPIRDPASVPSKGFFGRRTQIRRTPADDEESTLSWPLYDLAKGTPVTKAGPLIRCMYQNWSARVPLVYNDIFSPNVTSDPKSMSIQDLFASASSTAYDFACWLETDSPNLSDVPFPVVILLRIICSDVIEYAHLVASTLGDINREILDDVLFQQHLLHWQTLLGRFELQCRTTRASLVQFAAILLPDALLTSKTTAAGATADAGPLKRDTPIDALLSQTLARLDALREHARATSTALMASIESEKIVAEAESVGKLTELAFVFIPLSFSASVFGMQVKELDPSSTSIAAFFVLSIVSIVFLYAARLAVRSTSLRRFRRGLLANMRRSAGLVGRTPVPMLTFLRYAAVESARSVWRAIVGSALPVLIFAVVMLLMLLPVWLSLLDAAVKTAITIPLVLVGAVLPGVWYLFYAVHSTGGTSSERDDLSDQEG